MTDETFERYAFATVYGILIAVHGSMLLRLANEPALSDAFRYGHGGFIAGLIAILVWILRAP